MLSFCQHEYCAEVKAVLDACANIECKHRHDVSILRLTRPASISSCTRVSRPRLNVFILSDYPYLRLLGCKTTKCTANTLL